MSDEMEKVFGRYSPEIKVISGAYRNTYTMKDDEAKQEIDTLMSNIKSFEQENGRRPRILVGTYIFYIHICNLFEHNKHI